MARYLIKFSKGKGIKFISHLDIMRSIQRAIRRSGIPVSYSKGFNPHGQFSFATPLPVGTWSTGEYMEIKLDEDIGENELKDRVNEFLTGDIKFIYVKKISGEFPALMSIVEAATYEITMTNIPEGGSEEISIEEFLNRSNMEVIKVSKKGKREVDIKPMIYDLNIKNFSKEELVFEGLLATGSRSNLSPELLVEAMKLYICPLREAELRDVRKYETYAKAKGGFVTLAELAESGYQ